MSIVKELLPYWNVLLSNADELLNHSERNLKDLTEALMSAKDLSTVTTIMQAIHHQGDLRAFQIQRKEEILSEIQRIEQS
jgi:hypothetical protein